MSIISNLIRKSKTIDGPLNILSFFYDGKFDIDLLVKLAVRVLWIIGT